MLLLSRPCGAIARPTPPSKSESGEKAYHGAQDTATFNRQISSVAWTIWSLESG